MGKPVIRTAVSAPALAAALAVGSLMASGKLDVTVP